MHEGRAALSLPFLLNGGQLNEIQIHSPQFSLSASVWQEPRCRHIRHQIRESSSAECGKPAQLASGKPVARVNSAILTDADLIREEYAIFPYAKQHNGIPKEFEKQVRDGALKMITFEELAYQEAERRKMSVPAAKLQRAAADFRKQFATPEEYSAFLQTDFNGSQQLLQDKIRRSLLIEAFLKAKVEDRSVISPAEVRAYYDKNPVRFHYPESFTFQTISILPPPNATASQLSEVRARAESALKQAKATKTVQEFGLLAEKISNDDYRVMMGQHKPLPVDQLLPQVVKVLRRCTRTI